MLLRQRLCSFHKIEVARHGRKDVSSWGWLWSFVCGYWHSGPVPFESALALMRMLHRYLCDIWYLLNPCRRLGPGRRFRVHWADINVDHEHSTLTPWPRADSRCYSTSAGDTGIVLQRSLLQGGCNAAPRQRRVGSSTKSVRSTSVHVRRSGACTRASR